jgi:hypothetical protein
LPQSVSLSLPLAGRKKSTTVIKSGARLLITPSIRRCVKQALCSSPINKEEEGQKGWYGYKKWWTLCYTPPILWLEMERKCVCVSRPVVVVVVVVEKECVQKFFVSVERKGIF